QHPNAPESGAHAHVVDGIASGIGEVEHDRCHRNADAAQTQEQPETHPIVPREEGGRGQASDTLLAVARDLRPDAWRLPFTHPPQLLLGEVEGASSPSAAQPRLQPSLAATPGATGGPGKVEPTCEGEDP